MVVAGSTLTVAPEPYPLTYESSVPVETVLQVSTSSDIQSMYDIQKVYQDIKESTVALSPTEKYEEPNTNTVLCNCYRYVDSVVDLPHSSVIRNNLEDSGNVAVFYYPKSGLYHYAYVVAVDDNSLTISETNYRHCNYTERVISMEYPYLLGFYNA